MPPAKDHVVAVLERQGHVGGPGSGGQADGATGGFMHQPAAGHMVGMGVGVDRGHELHAQFADQGEIAGVLFKHRIDQHALATGHIHQQVGEGAGVGIEQLAHQQGTAASGGGQERGGGRRDGSHGRGSMH